MKNKKICYAKRNTFINRRGEYLYFEKNKPYVYVQLWHGGIIGFDDNNNPIYRYCELSIFYDNQTGYFEECIINEDFDIYFYTEKEYLNHEEINENTTCVHCQLKEGNYSMNPHLWNKKYNWLEQYEYICTECYDDLLGWEEDDDDDDDDNE